MKTISALAHPNIAFIKYWGNRDQALRLPANGSISMNLGALETRTSVALPESASADRLVINDNEQSGASLARVSAFLDVIRQLSGQNAYAEIISRNNFPSSAGVASSAAAFAALALAASNAFGLALSEKDLSRLARRGSGSACRSVPAGFCEWLPGAGDEDSYAQSFAAPDHWGLWDCVAIVEAAPKSTGSTEGHALAPTSPLQAARLADAPHRLQLCREAVLARDFEKLADVIEQDSNMMHAVMQTSTPRLMYWSPASLLLMNEVTALRRRGLAAAYTLDAGPNVHVICTAETRETIKRHLEGLPGVSWVLASPVGGCARLLDAN